jgi:hypothetical protein
VPRSPSLQVHKPRQQLPHPHMSPRAVTAMISPGATSADQSGLRFGGAGLQHGMIGELTGREVVFVVGEL